MRERWFVSRTSNRLLTTFQSKHSGEPYTCRTELCRFKLNLEALYIHKVGGGKQQAGES